MKRSEVIQKVADAIVRSMSTNDSMTVAASAALEAVEKALDTILVKETDEDDDNYCGAV